MPPPQKHNRRFVTIGLAICTAACISSSHYSLVPTTFAFASDNRGTKNRFFPNRSLFGRVSSPLFSTDSASNKAPLGMPPLVTPTANVVNGASSLEASFVNGSSGSTNDNEADDDNLLSTFRKVSNFASFLCVLDCTLLPLVTVALPLLGVMNLGASQLEAIDKLGHSLALYFVLPVGSTTTVINYLSHKKKYISALAFLGLVMVGLANSHIHVHHWPALGPVSLDWIGSALHKIQGCGTSPWHRIVNVSGCAFLLGSNYWSQQQDGCAAHGIAGGGDCSGHDHNHSHDHGGGCN